MQIGHPARSRKPFHQEGRRRVFDLPQRQTDAPRADIKSAWVKPTKPSPPAYMAQGGLAGRERHQLGLKVQLRWISRTESWLCGQDHGRLRGARFIDHAVRRQVDEGEPAQLTRGGQAVDLGPLASAPAEPEWADRRIGTAGRVPRPRIACPARAASRPGRPAPAGRHVDPAGAAPAGT